MGTGGRFHDGCGYVIIYLVGVWLCHYLSCKGVVMLLCRGVVGDLSEAVEEHQHLQCMTRSTTLSTSVSAINSSCVLCVQTLV